MWRSIIALSIALIFISSCLESNPQPSPVEFEDTSVAGDTMGPNPTEDTEGHSDASATDVLADGTSPPEDSVETEEAVYRMRVGLPERSREQRDPGSR